MRTWLVWALVACNGDKDDTGNTGDTGGPQERWTVLGDETNLPAAGLLSLWGSSSDMFVVGADDGQGPVVLHWDGSVWTRLDTGTTGDLWWVWSDGGDTVWMSGEAGRMLTYTRSTGAFAEEVITNPVYKLFGVWGTSPTDIWTVGGDITGNADGVILHWDGVSWGEAFATPREGTPGGPRQAFKVWGSGPSDVWVVGTFALVMHWDGAVWESFPPPVYETTTLTTVSGTGPDGVWMVGGPGNARVAHWDGTTLTDDTPPPQDIVPGFNGVYASSTHGVVACGESGSIYWRADTGWEADPRAVATEWAFHACWIDDEGSVWAVGGDLTGLTQGVIVYGGDSASPVSL
jgi:hypothetical protein